MAILFLDGFEMYSSVLNDAQYVSLADRYTQAGSSTFTDYFSVGDMTSGAYIPGSIGSRGLISVSSPVTANAMYYNLSNVTNICVGLHFKVGSNNSAIFSLGHSGAWTTNRIGMAVSSSGLVSIIVQTSAGASTMHTSDVIPIILNNWYYVELRVQVLGQNVNAWAYKNGKLIATLNNQLVLNSNPSFQVLDRLAFGNLPTGSTSQSLVTYDNLYITDGEVLGPLYLSPLLPSADTIQKDWGSTGPSNYNQINETTGAKVTDRVTSITSGEIDYYEHNPIPVNDGIYNVKGIQDICVYSTDPESTTEFTVNIDTGTSETVIDTISVPIGTDLNKQIKFSPILTNNPDTSLPFEISELNNTKIGLERTS